MWFWWGFTEWNSRRLPAAQMAVKIRQVDAPHRLRNAALEKYHREEATFDSSLPL